MSFMQDILKLPAELGAAVRAARKASGLTATAIAERSGRARNVLYRLEAGGEVSVGSLLDILRVLNLGLRLEPLAPPTLDEVRQRFGADDDDDAA